MKGGGVVARLGLSIRGIVQGVGFRPFLYRLAADCGISGFARNTGDGVYLEAEGTEAALSRFLHRLEAEPPALARIAAITQCPLPETGARGFTIAQSGGGHGAFISPDIAICPACRRELGDPHDRRYRYPFLNCTDCGPRFTILRDLPYDRANTTMAAFPLCPACAAEYHDPANRRFHAQPTACPVCGPRLRLYTRAGPLGGDPVAGFTRLMGEGKLAAVKGLGGFHLACDGLNEAAVYQLRQRKRRYQKPLALMLRDVDTVRQYCRLSPAEEALLTSRRAPIVLLEKLREPAPSVAPGNRRLGVMLPYTPLHVLLAADNPVLVMTSANVSDRPMCYEEEAPLLELADAVLTHDRPIYRRMDDSVAAVSRGAARLLRRARGWTPEPLSLPGCQRQLLALGAQQKSAFCMVKGESAFLSGYLGDLDDPLAEDQYRRELEDWQRMFAASPSLAVCDLHPDYVSTRLGETLGLPLRRVQHHKAHVAAVLAEHRCFDRDTVGFAFDGTGYGEDGTLWGGEVMTGGLQGLTRAGTLLPFPLPSGEAAIREPWRCGLSLLEAALGPEEAAMWFHRRGADPARLLRLPLGPLSSGMGRLFDGVSALCGLGDTADYEGQAAERLEQAADPAAGGSYGFELLSRDGLLVFDWRQLIRDLAADLGRGVPVGTVALRFHRAAAALPLLAVRRLGGGHTVVLSGGCFQNELLYSCCRDGLERAGYRVLSGEQAPVNDGGVALGQAALAAYEEGE